MKKTLLLIIVLTFGLYPILEQGKLRFGVAISMADSWGDEGGGGDYGGGGDPILASLSNTLDLDIVGTTQYGGETVYVLRDGTLWNPNSGNLDEVQIIGYKTKIIDDFPDLFPPNTPAANPDNWTFPNIIGYVSQPNTGQPPGKKTPCQEAKDLTNALNAALAKKRVKDGMDSLKLMVNSSVEHGFLITKNSSGYTALPIVEGTGSNVEFTYPSGTEVEFVVHVHTLDKSIAPSSTDIYGLNNYGPGFKGNIILHGTDMYLLSVTDRTKYNAFITKSTSNGYYDRFSENGWKKDSRIYDEYESFSQDYAKMNPGDDGAYPAQLHLMEEFKMGTTLQKWNAESNKFQPVDVVAEYRDMTGSSTKLGGSGNVLNSRYEKIEVKTVNCPN